MKKIITIFSLLFVTAILLMTLYKSSVEKGAPEAALTFSSTQAWDEDVAKHLLTDLELSPEEWSALRLPSPPPEEPELTLLRDLMNARTTEIENRILIEANSVTGMIYNGVALGDLLQNRPLTSRLLDQTWATTTAIVVQEKARFDRVRPAFLDPEIKPFITTPGHPAYPSGHSTQAHFIAFLFSELDPPNRSSYLADAWSIAVNREYAGVHYRSDTVAGIDLAERIFNLFLSRDGFRVELEAARSEWP